MISPTPMRTAADIRRNECAVESRKKNPDRYCDPDSGAGNQSRTDDLVITNDVLYQLSHASKIVVFSVDPTIISNFSPFVNPFLKIFLGGSGEDLGGREPPLERWGSLPPNLPHSPRTSPKSTRLYMAKICFALFGAGALGGSSCRLGRYGLVAECGCRARLVGRETICEARETVCGLFLADCVPVECGTYQTAPTENVVL